jgi:exonuclease III
LDWTPTVAKYKLCPIAVEWPSSKAVTDAGFADTYRAVHPDPVVDPGRTWTPITSRDDPKDRHDRIDFVFVYGKDAKVKAAQTYGESRQTSDVEVERYPSDHRLVVATVELPQEK